MCHFRDQNGSFVMNKIFLVQAIIINFIYLLALFKFKKILTADPELRGCTILGPKWSTCPKQNFLWKIIKIILIYLLALFIVQNFKKNSSIGCRVTRMQNFWAQNGPFPQMTIFFRKPVNQPYFFHSCLSTCQKSSSDINLLLKY